MLHRSWLLGLCLFSALCSTVVSESILDTNSANVKFVRFNKRSPLPENPQTLTPSPSSDASIEDHNIAADIVVDVLEEVRHNADRLENDLRRNNHLPSPHSPVLETVVKITDDDEAEDADESEAEKGIEGGKRREETDEEKLKKVVTLIDQENNQYILTRPFDTTVIYEDIRFLHDLILIFIVSFFLGCLFHSIGLPAFFGYILSGCILGPAGFNVIKEIIQVESLAQLGVILIVFVLGLEFSFDKIRAMWRIALGGALLILFLSIACFVIGGMILGSSLKEAVFVGACISLSSTAVVVKSVRADDLEPLYGLLVMQDVLLGLMLAVTPALSKPGLAIFLAIGKLAGSILVFGAVSYLLYRLFMVSKLFKRLHASHELLLLGYLCLCLTMLLISELLGVGMELGCFVAGVILRSRRANFEVAVSMMEPVRDVFACLFFASIGLHVYPSFLVDTSLLLITLTAAVIGFKYMITSIVLVLFRFELQQSSTMAIGLAQISEFGFVLASRAKQLGVITREVYYLLIAVTSLTLIAAPLLWKLIRKRRGDHATLAGKRVDGAMEETSGNIDKVVDSLNFFHSRLRSDSVPLMITIPYNGLDNSGKSE
ncbi:uncharacterized protein VTP21DRAFT_6008 [Calcarisporiella thermophila]|uniref:uncharacterized protein n=1 Tax=Calcarisporiella thermophila TaxID=911321 RepID=UPI003744A373